MKTHLKKISIVSYFLSIVVLILAGVIVAKGAWNPPTGAAPGTLNYDGNNTAEPINVGLGSVPAQWIQNGALGINGVLDVVSNAFFENKVGIGIGTDVSKLTGALNVVGNVSIMNGNLSVDPDYGITVGNVLISNQTLNSSVSNFQARTFSGGALVAGSTYYYKITAKVSGNFISSVVSSPCFVGSGDNACKLSWESLSGASVYAIYGRPFASDGTFNFIACIPSNTNIYTDTGTAGSNTCRADEGNPPSGVITKISGIGAMSMSGALGIGTATPTDTMLEVSNSISDNILKLSRLGANSTIFKIGGSDSAFAIQPGGSFKILNSSGADKFVVQQNGNAAISGTLSAGATTLGTTAINGDLSMSGSLTGGTIPWARLTDVPANPTYDVIADGGLRKDGNNFGLMTSGCSDGQVLKFNGSDWSCQNDAGGITGSGTDNKLAKWSSGGLAESIIYDNGTNVGIGTTVPGQKLEIVGSSNTTFHDGFSFKTLGGATPNRHLEFEQLSTTGFQIAIKDSYPEGISADGTLSLMGGNVGIGTADPSTYKLRVQGADNFNGGTYIGGNFQVTDNSFFVGKVGIGTDDPKNKLDVNGGVAIGSYAGVNNAGNNNLIISGNVGIGLINPDTSLVVQGNVKLLRDPAVLVAGVGPSLILESSSGASTPSAISTEIACYTSAGNIGSCSGKDNTGTTEELPKLNCDNLTPNQVYTDVYLVTGNFYKSKTIKCLPGTASYSLQTNNGNFEMVSGGGTKFSIDQSGIAAIGGAVDSSFKLRVYGDVKANQFSTGDLLFNHNGRVVWRMYEDEQGLYVQSPITGKRYRMMMEEIE